MKLLKGKTIYTVATGCNKSKSLQDLIRPLIDDGANIIFLPTEQAQKIASFNDEIFSKCIMKIENGTDATETLPEEDLVIVAPCSFNTFNKLANGIADTYQTSIIHNAIGKGKPVIISLSMNTNFWNNFSTKTSLSRFENVNNVTVIWPEFIYNKNGELGKLTMSPFEKVIDTIYKDLKIVRFENCRNIESNNIAKYNKCVEENIEEFKFFGKVFTENYLTRGNMGCIAKKVSEGILVTSSGCQLSNINKKNLTLILSHANKKIEWVGENIPSSESPMFCDIFNSIKDINCILHSHCGKITYSQRTIHLNTKKYHLTGLWRDNEIIKIMQENNNIANMKLHGQVVGDKTFYNVLDKILKTYYSLDDDK